VLCGPLRVHVIGLQGSKSTDKMMPILLENLGIFFQVVNMHKYVWNKSQHLYNFSRSKEVFKTFLIGGGSQLYFWILFLCSSIIKMCLLIQWIWWYTPVILALGRLRQEDHEFPVRLNYRTRP
jgi:hypothetical protein